jgi:hypothetical protein
MTNVSRTNQNGKRPKSNFYPTPAGATRALIAHERAALKGLTIWEPAAGDGAIGAEFRGQGFDVRMSELRGVARRSPVRRMILGGADFFEQDRLMGEAIVTNPPYGKKVCDRFIRHALNLRPRYAAFFLPLVYLAGIGRADLIEGATSGLSLQRVLVFRERVTLAPRGLKLKSSGVVAYAWFVWEQIDSDGAQPPLTIHRISQIESGEFGPGEFEGAAV